MSNFKNYANSFQAVARLELECIRKLCEALGNPQNDLKFIHVAGTNGKGSVCAILQKALTHAGYKTGKYISPNLIDVTERISVDGVDIASDELERILNQVKQAADTIKEKDGIYPTQFEIWTATAFLYFKEKAVDIVVLETGLGGEMDATNIVENTLCSVITPISHDHISYLGNDITKIAAAKAGIIKPSTFSSKRITVSSEQIPEVMEVIKSKAAKQNNDLFIADKKQSKGTSEIYEIFDFDSIKDIVCGLGGMHQLDNAALACEVLKRLGISDEDIRFGVENAKNPARLEILSNNPFVLFDGAHNLSGAAALTESLKRYFPNEKFTFLCAFMQDKDCESMIEKFAPFATRFIATSVPDNPRSMSAEVLSKIMQRVCNNTAFENEVNSAINRATESGKTVICGSLYLYQFAKYYFS